LLKFHTAEDNHLDIRNSASLWNLDIYHRILKSPPFGPYPEQPAESSPHSRIHIYFISILIL